MSRQRLLANLLSATALGLAAPARAQTPPAAPEAAAPQPAPPATPAAEPPAQPAPTPPPAPAQPTEARPAAAPEAPAPTPPAAPVSLGRPLRTARRPYVLYPWIDVLATASAAAVWLPPEAMWRELVPLGRCPCDPAMLNPLDRPVAGWSVPGTGPASNAFTGILLALPAAIDALDVGLSRGTFWEWLEDTLVLGEALMVGGALNEMTKLALQRPRPALYGIDPGSALLNDPDSYLSFYSLAGAEIFTAAVAGSVTFALRHPRSPWRWVYLAGALTGATAFGATRFAFGRHFPTDVLAAAAIGSLVGLVIPYLHVRPLHVGLGAQVAPGSAVLTVNFALY